MINPSGESIIKISLFFVCVLFLHKKVRKSHRTQKKLAIIKKFKSHRAYFFDLPNTIGFFLERVPNLRVVSMCMYG